MRSAEGGAGCGAVGERSPQAEASASPHTRKMPTRRRRAAFIGLPSPLGRREFGGNARIDGWAAEYVGYKMHTSSPSLREDGHSETCFAFFGLLVFAAILRKKGVVRPERGASAAGGPQPSRPSYAARITVRGAHDAGEDGI